MIEVRGLNIAIDGPAASGKTTIGRMLAQQLDYLFIDTGNIYRAATWACLQERVDFADEGAVAQATRQAELILRHDERVLLNGQDVTTSLKSAEVERHISQLSAYPSVRGALLERQRTLSQNGGVVMVGRDIGTVVLPDADLKLYVTASATVRAQRRYAERQEVESLSYDEILVEILRRDEADRTRKHSPLQSAETAMTLDTTEATPQEVLQRILDLPLLRKLLSPRYTLLPVDHPTGVYPLMIGRRLLSSFRELTGWNGPYVVISDTNVAPLYAHHFSDALGVLTVPASETSKSLEQAAQLFAQLVALGLDRSGLIVALGGGVVGDLAGFIAATYMRGIPFVQCPTSLLAMVDASVGGKVGIDLPSGKNLVGAFKQPLAVLADLETLATLPDEEKGCGMAEVIKHGLLGDADLFEWLEGQDEVRFSADSWQQLVTRAVEVKRKMVQRDPYEYGDRALLNLGHTFGHAIEKVSAYGVPHGYAVAMGTVVAVRLSAEMGVCSADLPSRIEKVLQKYQLPIHTPALPLDQLLEAMGSDKKKMGKQMRYILLRKIGLCIISAEPNIETIRKVWQTAIESAVTV